jgi:hypothetical protein
VVVPSALCSAEIAAALLVPYTAWVIEAQVSVPVTVQYGATVVVIVVESTAELLPLVVATL